MAAKQCTRCGVTKPVSQFNKSRGRPREMCKVCHSAHAVMWQKNNRERYRERQNEWTEKNRERTREYGRAAYKRLSAEQKKRIADRAKARYLVRKYGISPAQWADLLAAQGGVCAICRIPGRLGRHGKLAVDHCHTTGRVRGLLCGPCNVAIGILGDTPEALARVSAYVSGQ